MSRPSILIVGAGVAGLALAAEVAGFAEATVLERDPALRRGGQTVDLRGPSRTVVDRLGVGAELLALRVPQRGYAIVDADGRPLVRHPVELFDGHGIVSDTEVLRGDLLDVLARAAGPARFRFGTTVRTLHQDQDQDQHQDGVEVGFPDGTRQRFDLVVGADGVGSTVRRLALGPDPWFRTPLGVGIAWFSADGDVGGPGADWYRAHHAPGLRVAVRPSRDPGSFRCELAFRCRGWDAPRGGREALLDDLDRRFAGVGWHARALLEAARTAGDLAAQDVATVRVPRWSSGRVVLLGDAAWCPSPLTGMGTAMALVGAHVLAAALRDASAARWSRDALPAFQDRLGDWVARSSRLPPGGVAGFVPGSRLALAAGRASMRWMGRPPFRAAARRVFAHPDDLDLTAGPLTAPVTAPLQPATGAARRDGAR